MEVIWRINSWLRTVSKSINFPKGFDVLSYDCTKRLSYTFCVDCSSFDLIVRSRSSNGPKRKPVAISLCTICLSRNPQQISILNIPKDLMKKYSRLRHPFSLLLAVDALRVIIIISMIWVYYFTIAEKSSISSVLQMTTPLALKN